MLACGEQHPHWESCSATVVGTPFLHRNILRKRLRDFVWAPRELQPLRSVLPSMLKGCKKGFSIHMGGCQNYGPFFGSLV